VDNHRDHYEIGDDTERGQPVIGNDIDDDSIGLPHSAFTAGAFVRSEEIRCELR
jgi:hypothetical protein